MGRFQGLKMLLIRALFYSIGLAIFLSAKWIDPEGSFINNIIAGFVLYLTTYILAYIVTR